MQTYIDYSREGELCYWRSRSNFEVDFVLNGRTAIEVKAKAAVGQRDLRGLNALREEKALRRYVVVSLEPRQRRVDGIDVMPWQVFLRNLWAGELD